MAVFLTATTNIALMQAYSNYCAFRHIICLLVEVYMGPILSHLFDLKVRAIRAGVAGRALTDPGHCVQSWQPTVCTSQLFNVVRKGGQNKEKEIMANVSRK